VKRVKAFKKRIDENGISEELLGEIITAAKKDQDRMKKLYDTYNIDPVEGPTILHRNAATFSEFADAKNIQRLDDKVDNRLNNAFDVDIVDTKVGYMFGHPISYEVDKTMTSLKILIEEFLLRNNVEDNDSECGKMAAICGMSARLLYIDLEGNERIKNIDPWEVIFIGEDVHEPSYSFWKYKIEEGERIEFYDEKDVWTFDNFDLVDVRPHVFDLNPLFGIANNKELKGDAEKVRNLIDAYDRTLSDASNEIEQYRLAYLILKGMGADEDTLEQMKKAGILELLGEHDEVKYLTKDINDQMIENHLDRLEKNIMRFAKSVNFSDETFAGNVSGVAMKFKIMALENKSITMERKFNSSLRYQFKVLFTAWSKRRGVNPNDYLKMWFSWKRNLPINVLDEAQSTQALKGYVSEKTRLSQLSIVDDVEFEMREMENDLRIMGERLPPLEDDEDESTRD